MTKKALGITDGIGSLLYGPRNLGFEILGNYEWRKYYNTGTFEKNFRAPYITDYQDRQASWRGLDLVTSHPECGNFSNLYTGTRAKEREVDPGDIKIFMDLAKYYQPKHFLCDNLPKSLLAVTPQAWSKFFKDYWLQFLWISNWGYGNTQKNRNRLFVAGTHKDIDWQFIPQEKKHDSLLEDAIHGIRTGDPNHQIMSLDDYTQWRWYQLGKPHKQGQVKLKDLQSYFRQHKIGHNLFYYNRAGERKMKPGYSVVRLEHTSPVLSGGGGFYDNHWIEDPTHGYIRPLSARERLAIQGFKKDFILIPGEYDWGTKEHQSAIKQTGKCMPVEFPTEFARQILKGNKGLTPCLVNKVPPIIENAQTMVNRARNKAA